MTAKEKATHLYNSYHYKICNDNGISENDSTEFCAKQCALLAANEVVDVLISNAIDAENEKLLLYWNRVIEEIEKL